LVGGNRTGGPSRGILIGGLWEVVDDAGNGISTSRRTPSQHHEHCNSLVEIDSDDDLRTAACIPIGLESPALRRRRPRSSTNSPSTLTFRSVDHEISPQ
jgi:hypothetical protein